MFRRRGYAWEGMGIVLLGAALRLCRLGARSLWFDEALSGCIARLDGVSVLTNVAGSSHPPGYYFLLHLWLPVCGSSELALRFPSAAFSLLAVALTYRLARMVLGKQAGWMAALGMAFSPFQLYYAQEARMYGLAIALSAGIVWAFLQGVRGRQWALWAYGLLVALGLYVHYYIGLVVLSLHLWLVVRWRWDRAWLRGLLVADGLAVLAFLPQAAQFLREASEFLSGAGWRYRPNPLSPLTTLYYLIFGHVLPLELVGAGLFLVLAVLTFAGLALAHCGREEEVWALALTVIAPPLVVLALSLLAGPAYLERSFAVVTPALLPLMAWTVSRAPRRSPVPYLGMALGALMIAGGWFYFCRPDPVKPPIREAAETVAGRWAAGDVSLHLQDSSYLPALLYTPETAGVLVDAGQRTWLRQEVYALFGGEVRPVEVLPQGNRTWLTVMPGYNDDAQRAFLARVAPYCSAVQDWEAVQVYLCTSPGLLASSPLPEGTAP